MMCARASWRLALFRHLSEYLESLHRCESTMPAKKGCLHVKEPRHPVPLPENYFFKLDTETRAPPTQTRTEPANTVLRERFPGSHAPFTIQSWRDGHCYCSHSYSCCCDDNNCYQSPPLCHYHRHNRRYPPQHDRPPYPPPPPLCSKALGGDAVGRFLGRQMQGTTAEALAMLGGDLWTHLRHLG